MPEPTNPLVGAMLTDLYQLTMAYGYWESRIADRPAAFELHFRRNPFGGEYAIVAGLRDALAYLETFRFDPTAISWLRSLPSFVHARDEFWPWLARLDTSLLRVHAIPEGTPVFPRVPLLRVEGPLAIAQIVETALLNIINFSTLIATNAARLRYVAGATATLMEFGLRRAQGPDGSITATRSAIIGGFDSTSNVLAGHLLDVPVAGTHAHSYVQSFMEVTPALLSMRDVSGNVIDISEMLRETIDADGYATNEGELAAFLSYARAFPESTLLLVDTYDTLTSGVPNAIRVFKVLRSLGHTPVGVRLDSGDLAYLSRETRRMFREAGLEGLRIVASNAINESVLAALVAGEADIDAYGIGTHLVTAQGDPALGGVYKMVEFDGKPRMKVSQDTRKMTIPGTKRVYRLVGSEGYYLADVMTLEDEPAPAVGHPFVCRHPSIPEQQVRIVPTEVLELQVPVFEGGKSVIPEVAVTDIRERSKLLQRGIRPDHRRQLNPTPYKVSVSESLYDQMHALWEHETAVRTIR